MQWVALALGALKAPLGPPAQVVVLGLACDALWPLQTVERDSTYFRAYICGGELPWPREGKSALAPFDEAATALQRDSALVTEVRAARPRLAPNQIGKHGQLQEWLDDWDEIEPRHRHLSPLWGLYPGREITPQSSPALAAAAAVTLTRRGTGGCGWSYSWKAGLQARLSDGAAALDQLRALLTRSSLPNFFSLCGRALQVDGNLGATAAIAELLLQSHQDAIHLLPALPAEWPEGSVQGLRARGGFDVGVTWSRGRATRATILAHLSRRCRVQVPGGASVTADGKRVRVTRLGADTVEFTATAGQLYQLAIGPVR